MDALLDIHKCSTVSAAMAVCTRRLPDLIFIDLKIETNAETNPEIAKLRYQGIYFLQWLRERYSATLPIKVHSQFADVDEVQRHLEKADIKIRSLFPLDDHLMPGDRLKRNFPECLRNIAIAYLASISRNAEIRKTIKETLQNAIKKGNK